MEYGRAAQLCAGPLVAHAAGRAASRLAKQPPDAILAAAPTTAPLTCMLLAEAPPAPPPLAITAAAASRRRRMEARSKRRYASMAPPLISCIWRSSSWACKGWRPGGRMCLSRGGSTWQGLQLR